MLPMVLAGSSSGGFVIRYVFFDSLYTSGFMDDVIFAHNGPCAGTCKFFLICTRMNNEN